MVAFGLAPAVLVYQWGIAQLAELGWVWGKLGWLAAFLYAVATALRLARFNSRSTSSDKRFFEGLPCPSAAATVAGMVWLAIETGWTGPLLFGCAFVVTAATGGLMVSRFAYYSFKEISAGGRIPFTYVLVIPLSFILIALDPPLVLFCMATCYGLSGPALGIWRKIRRRERRQRISGQDSTPR
jgi:CDP-diacylglycerol--serine O-phosphatidyltransferase